MNDDAAIEEINRLEAILYDLTDGITGTLQRDKIERLEGALYSIQQWSEAYPLAVFPEPDLKKARILLEAGGITLDAISAHCMRHCVEGVGKIAREALAGEIDIFVDTLGRQDKQNQ